MSKFLIDNECYELILEDGDIAVLQNIYTGEPLTMPVKDIWNYAV